jgi:hypothetical protein
LGEPVRVELVERLLFDYAADGKAPAVPPPEAPPPAPRFTEPVLRVYAKDFANHALKHLPQAVKYRSVEEFRKHLAEKLKFNSEATRRRSANYIVSRFFPGDVYHADVLAFAAATAGKPALGEALFYLTCRTERIMSLVAEDVVFPALTLSGISRARLREYIQGKFPDSKSVDHIAQAVVETYEFYGIGTANRTRLSVSLREGNLVVCVHPASRVPGARDVLSGLWRRSVD